MKNRNLYFSWFIIALLLGVIFKQPLLKFFVADFSSSEQMDFDKLEEIITLTETHYVGNVDWDKAISGAIEGMLNSLDPHSVYFDPVQGESNDESFEGKYQGIGIQYDVIEGFINVITVIPGSPSEKVGIFAGDIIVEIDGESAFGISNAEVPKKLKGPKNSVVEVAIQREGFDDNLKFEITRDEIPIYTINTHFMANDSTGYVWVNRFANTTADELESALIKLEKKGMKQLVLDLRYNGGGYLWQAVKIVGKFISGRKKVVFTKGRFQKVTDEHFTDDYGKSIDRDFPLVVMINHSSASASEIVAGAIQDYDRGVIVGTRSFGKGLVQNEFVLNDESRLRLTVSKYYTPSGRLIQKPYENKSINDYYSLAHVGKDSIQNSEVQDSLMVYHTSKGREVFGGGGIKPDIVVADSGYTNSPKLTQKLLEKRIFFEVASHYANSHKNIKDNREYFFEKFEVSDKLFRELQKVAKQKEINFDSEVWNADIPFLKNRLKAEIARSIWSQNEFYRVILEHDNQFETALKSFPKARAIQNQLVKIESKID
ncbi:MAG: S41 family peptidase [Calditrichaeota bacterium]|nr:MAG: S41 family peptidase [Calditrichota bacterium]MBL1207461.1 S41 family peptidase [Calditrichota bacterium]NOG47293.1 S41 family peptidase [Calditrichota bacterium]